MLRVVFFQETEERKARLAAYKEKKSKSNAMKIRFFVFFLVADLTFSKNTFRSRQRYG